MLDREAGLLSLEKNGVILRGGEGSGGNFFD